MASIQARHSRACATGRPWTTAGDVDGCTCAGGATLYVVTRVGAKLHRERVGKNRRAAERRLTKTQAAEDEGSFEPVRRMRFDAWTESWLVALERKENTRRAYRSTVAYATRAFGHKQVRAIGVDDVRRLLVAMREQGLSDSTRAKHARVLGACFASALAAGYTTRNPVRAIPRGEKPRARKKESPYFEADEVRRLFAAVEPGPYRVLFLTALKSGMRLGELSALLWRDLDLVAGVARVRRGYTDGMLAETKTNEIRDVDLVPELVEALGAWWGELGRPADETLVFPGATLSGYLNPKTVLSELYRALAAAGVPRTGATGGSRVFHSWRHTFAKTVLENGGSITWLKSQLGHSSITVTIDRYGHWERAARKREVEALAGAFPV